MELINREIEEQQKSESKDWAISKGQKFVKANEEKPVSPEEKDFYTSGENVNKTFISKNRIY